MIRNGSRFTVSMAQAFPSGCCLVPDSIAEAQDYDERTRTRSPAVDKVTGKRVFQVRVSRPGPRAGGPPREVVVKVLADRLPVPPSGAYFEPVEFENLTVTPYVTDKGRMAWSLRATGLKAARQPAHAAKDGA